MPEGKTIQPKTKDWAKSLTSNPFIQKKLSERDPAEVMMMGAAKQTGNFALLFDCDALLQQADQTGVLDTTAYPFRYAAKSEVWSYWLRNPIQSIKTQLRR